MSNANIINYIAVGAWLPWIITWVSKLFIRSKVDIYPSKTFLVGFNENGPLIILHGTLKASGRDVFIENMEVKIKKKKTSEEHKFSWFAFGSSQINIYKPEDYKLELPGSFMVLTRQPHRYLIMFSDTETQMEMRPFQEACVKESVELASKYGLYTLKQFQPELKEEYLKEYSKSKSYLNAITELTQVFYWDKGDYEITIEINTDKPRKRFTTAGQFTLSDKDYESLRLNIMPIINNPTRNTLGEKPWIYYFATVPCEPIEK